MNTTTNLYILLNLFNKYSYEDTTTTKRFMLILNNNNYLFFIIYNKFNQSINMLKK